MTRHGTWLAVSLLAAALPAVCANHASADASNDPSNDGSAVDLAVTVGKSLILDTAADLRRVSVANGDLAEALAVNPREVLVNGKAAGETSLILWQQDGARTLYNLTVRPNTARIEAVQGQLRRGLPGQDVSLDFENETAFLRGTVKDLSSAERAAGMAATLGKVVNLLRVEVPPAEPQILLHVRFADVDRSATSSFGFNLLSTGGKTVGQITTGQFGPATPSISANEMCIRDRSKAFHSCVKSARLRSQRRSRPAKRISGTFRKPSDAISAAGAAASSTKISMLRAE